MLDAIQFLQKSFLPTSIIFIVIFIISINSILGTVTAIKGSYVLLGLFAAAGFTYFFSGTEMRVSAELSERSTCYGKLCWVIIIVSVTIAVFLGNRLPVLLFSIPIVYILIVFQIWNDIGKKLILSQIIGVFLLSTSTKYLTTGYYFGEVDILDHMYLTEELLRNGFIAGIPSVTYRFFPGLHIQTAAVRMITDLSTYDSLIMLGISIYSISIPLIYLISVLVFQNRTLALTTTIVVSALPDIVFYSTYFFPQSFAVVIGLFIIYFAIRASTVRCTRRPRLVILGSLLALSMVFVHHFTFVLFIPIIAVLASIPLIERILYTIDGHIDKAMVNLLPIYRPLLFLPLLLALIYWSAFDLFFGELDHAITVMIMEQTLFVGDTGYDPGLYTIGYEIREQTPSLAAQSLLSFEGIFAISLVTTFLLSIQLILEDFDRYIYPFPFLLIGILGAVFVLPLPIDLTGRIGQPMNFFLAFVVAVALNHLLRSSGSVPRRQVIVLVMIVALTTSGHLVAADDIHDLDDGPGLNELYMTPDAQAEFNAHEHRSLKSVSRFTEAHEARVSTDWVSSSGIQRFGGSASDELTIANSNFHTDTHHLLYRTRWPEHQVYFNTTENQFYISQDRFEYIISTENKVYTTGEVGMLWKEDTDTAFGERFTAADTG